MSPYYQGPNVTLYLGDCLELKVPHDLLVTDPPYGESIKQGKGQGRWGMIHGDDDPEGVTLRLLHTLRQLRRGRHAYIFGGSLPLERLPLGSPCQLIWDKGTMGLGDLTLPWGPAHESITFAVYEPSKANREKGYGALAARLRKGSVLRSMRPTGSRVTRHPTEKPTDILRQMIESSSVMGETVYDPFAGSGSTLEAALLEERVAVGCEIHEPFAEVAAKRLEAFVRLLREQRA